MFCLSQPGDRYQEISLFGLCCEYEGSLFIKKKVVAFQNTNTRLDTGNNIFKESTFQVETVECIQGSAGWYLLWLNILILSSTAELMLITVILI